MLESCQKLPKNTLSQEDLKTRFDWYLKIKDLKKMIADMPDDGLVLVQRIEDFYFENNGWGVILKEGQSYNEAIKWNQDLESGKYKDRENYPLAKPDGWKPYSEEELKSMKDQYHPAWCVIKYGDDPDNLYLNLHY